MVMLMTVRKAYCFALLAACSPLPLAAQTATPAPAPVPAATDPAAAQAPVAPGSAAPAAAPQQAIGDIVVTARKTEEKLQNVPIAVTALSGAALKQQTIQGAQDLQFHVPGFVEYPEGQGGAPDFAIRGAKQQGVAGSQGGVAVYLDYVPLTSNYAIVNSTYDMQSVQVLKGPQGTLFGKNTTGGAIIFAPNKPTDRFEGSLTGEYGNYGRVDITGVVNVPITDGVALRVSGRYVHRDGYLDNLIGPDQDSENHHSIRAILRIQPTDRITSDTTFDYYHQRNYANPDVYAGAYNAATICGTYPDDCVNGHSQSIEGLPSYKSRKIAVDPTLNIGTFWGISNVTSYQLSDAITIRNIFGYRRDHLAGIEDDDGTPLPILDGRNDNHAHQLTDELDFIGKLFDDKLSYTVGLYYADNVQNQISDYGILAPTGGLLGVFGGGGGLPQFPVPSVDAEGNPITVNPISPSLQYNRFETKSKAIFGQANYKITDELTLTAGGRYNQDKGRFNSQQYQGYTDSSETAPLCNILAYADPDELVGPCEVQRKRTWNAFTWNASLNFKPDSRTLIYVSAGRGFQAGGFNQQIRETQYREYQPEKVFNVEAGLKKDWRLFDRPIRTNFAIFRASYKDQQRVENGTYSDGLNYIATFNAANSTIWGGELEINYLPTRNLDLSLSYSYINAKYDTFLSPQIENIPSADLSGLAIAATPKHTINGTIAYTLPLNPDDKLRFTLSGYYRSGTYFNDLSQGPYTYQKGYALLNGRVDLVRSSPVDIGFWMNNITNKTYGVFKFDNLSGLAYTSIFLGAPRTYGVDATFKF
jgi:iron complex outermembrane recepter protein